MAASERSSRLPRLDYENLDLLSLTIRLVHSCGTAPDSHRLSLLAPEGTPSPFKLFKDKSNCSTLVQRCIDSFRFAGPHRGLILSHRRGGARPTNWPKSAPTPALGQCGCKKPGTNLRQSVLGPFRFSRHPALARLHSKMALSMATRCHFHRCRAPKQLRAKNAIRCCHKAALICS